MKISVIGTGYVGLVSGVCFSEIGVDVICMDVDESKIEKLKEGIVPIFEPGLDEILNKNISKNRIEFTTDLKYTIENSEIVFLALPTPEGEDGSADLSYILDSSSQISKYINSYKIIVNKSTVPVGTAEKVSDIFDQNSKIKVDVVSNPEFLREGHAVDDFMKPNRVVIGSSSEEAIRKMTELYSPLISDDSPLIIMDEKSSEMTKYAANSFLALKISYINEMAQLAEKVGANIDKVRQGIGSDSRIGEAFLYAGLGFGGSCFPKDILALQKMSRDNEYSFRILDSLIEANRLQKTFFVNKIKNSIDLRGKNVGLWGLSFKPNTDDIREAPSLFVIEKLLEEGATISAYDPEAIENVKKKIGDKIEYSNDMYSVLEDADILVIVTEWNEFRSPNFDILKKKLKTNKIFDGRNIYKPSKMKNLGFDYHSVGRK